MQHTGHFHADQSFVLGTVSMNSTCLNKLTEASITLQFEALGMKKQKPVPAFKGRYIQKICTKSFQGWEKRLITGEIQ